MWMEGNIFDTGRFDRIITIHQIKAGSDDGSRTLNPSITNRVL